MNAATKRGLLHVAFTSNATAQQPRLNDATGYATPTQQTINNPLSLLDLARNKLCNNHATASQKSVQQAPEKVSDELCRLVRLCGKLYGFTEVEHVEALATALADFDSAMICFTALAHKAGLL